MSTTAQTPKSQTIDTTADTDLPEGWVSVTLPECAEIVMGQSPPGSTYNEQRKGLPFFQGKADFGERFPTARVWCTQPNKIAEPGDILISVRAPVGPTNLANQVCAIGRGLAAIRPSGSIPSEYILYALRLQEPEIALSGTGSTFSAISRKDLDEIAINFAPLPEQKRIIAKIEELFTQVNAARVRLAKVQKILKRFRQAVLAAACSGRLTEDWRKNQSEVEDATALIGRIQESHKSGGLGHGGKAAAPTEDVHTLSEDDLPGSWAIAELMWLCEPGRPITYGILKPGPDVMNGIPYVRVADFPNDQLNLAGIRKTSDKIAGEYRRSVLRSGDVLLSIRGTVGRVCRVPTVLDGANITQDTSRISVHPKMSADYVEMYLRCPSVQGRLEAAMKGVAVRGVNIGDVRALQVAVPSSLEQDEIVRRVEALFKLADAIGKRVEAATKRANKMTQAILAKAFRGELVPTEAELARREGRDYEPASDLLARIKANREESKEKANGIPRRRSRSRRSRKSNF